MSKKIVKISSKIKIINFNFIYCLTIIWQNYFFKNGAILSYMKQFRAMKKKHKSSGNKQDFVVKCKAGSNPIIWFRCQDIKTSQFNTNKEIKTVEGYSKLLWIKRSFHLQLNPLLFGPIETVNE